VKVKNFHSGGKLSFSLKKGKIKYSPTTNKNAGTILKNRFKKNFLKEIGSPICICINTLTENKVKVFESKVATLNGYTITHKRLNNNVTVSDPYLKEDISFNIDDAMKNPYFILLVQMFFACLVFILICFLWNLVFKLIDGEYTDSAIDTKSK
jgi:hypothetical protein